MMALKQLLPPRDICAITCYGTGYCYDNMGNLLSLSREGDMTSSLKGIVDNLLTSSLFKGQNKVSLIINILQIFNGDLG